MPVRVAFVGAGGIANAHMRALSQIEDARMVAFCDIDQARASAAAGTYGGKPYAELGAMLDAERPEAAYVCLPPHAHVGQEEELARRGIPFFVEKPIANTLERATTILEAVRMADLVTSVGYHWRYMACTRMARERLEGKTIGMALGYWLGGMPGVHWWRRMDMSAGQMVEQTTHIVDLARYLCGEIVEVYAAMTTRALADVEDFTVTDVGTMTAKFASGALGSFSNTCLLKGFGYTVGLHVVTQDIVVEVESSRCRALTAAGEEVVPPDGNPTVEEDRAFVRAVATGDRAGILSPYEDALRTLAVTLAANRSARNGRPERP